MKALILAAGLGTRLKPWTLEHPKALVPVGGVPMLERVIVSLRGQGFDHIVVNVHHFASQIVDFLSRHDFGVEIKISDESAMLLDTGGAVLHAAPLLAADDRPFLVHNVDILSDADLKALMRAHGGDVAASLLVSSRSSRRRLIFNGDDSLVAWHDTAAEIYRPDGYVPSGETFEYAFSGIYVLNASVPELMTRQGFAGKFSIMDFFLRNAGTGLVRGRVDNNLKLIDIGKPETLSQANGLFAAG